MFLALKEIRRAKARFALLAGAVALLAFLILFQQALQSALLTSFVGGVRNQTAPVLVFNVDGRRFPQSSTVGPELAEQVAGLEEVAAVAPLHQGTFPVTADGATAATSVLAYADPELGGPERLVEGRLPQRPGEVVANDADVDRGFGVGSVVEVAPAGLELEVVGVAEQVGLNVLPTLLTTPETYLEVLRTRNPEAQLPPANVLGVRPAEGTTPEAAAAAITAADDDLDALTREAAADTNPGVESIRQSFTVVFVLFAVVVPLVTGLFFLILTLQKAGSLTLLRAVGAPAQRLVSSLVAQAGVVLAVGLGLAAAGYAWVSGLRLDEFVLRFEPRVLLGWVAVLGSLGLLSTLASVRRVLRIDPIQATTGGGVGR